MFNNNNFVFVHRQADGGGSSSSDIDMYRWWDPSTTTSADVDRLLWAAAAADPPPPQSSESIVNSNVSSDFMPSSIDGSVVLDNWEYKRMVQAYRSCSPPTSTRTTTTMHIGFGSAAYNGIVSIPPPFEHQKYGLGFGQQFGQHFGIGELIRWAKNAGVDERRELSQQMGKNVQFRLALLQLVAYSGDELLLQLANDSSANFFIRGLIHCGCYSDKSNGILLTLFSRLENLAFKMALNRYACRVIIKLVDHLSAHQVKQLLAGHQFKGNESALINDQNANHFVQLIVSNFAPEVYADFVKSLASQSDNLTSVFENKYGCRVIQCILERVLCLLVSNQQLMVSTNADTAVAFEVLHALLFPILANARALAQHEFANYLVQFVLQTPVLQRQRRHIIARHLHSHVLDLARGKYSSHVVEQALCNASPDCLDALFTEVLDGYIPIQQGGNKVHTALNLMVFNQYGNYVVQQMIKIAIKARQRQCHGDTRWLERIANIVLVNQAHLARYSSGKRIIEMLRGEISSATASVNHNQQNILVRHYPNKYSNNWCDVYSSPPPPMPLRPQRAFSHLHHDYVVGAAAAPSNTNTPTISPHRVVRYHGQPPQLIEQVRNHW